MENEIQNAEAVLESLPEPLSKPHLLNSDFGYTVVSLLTVFLFTYSLLLG